MIFPFVNPYLDDVLFWLDRVMIPPSMASFRSELVSTSVSQGEFVETVNNYDEVVKSPSTKDIKEAKKNLN